MEKKDKQGIHRRLHLKLRQGKSERSGLVHGEGDSPREHTAALQGPWD